MRTPLLIAAASTLGVSTTGANTFPTSLTSTPGTSTCPNNASSFLSAAQATATSGSTAPPGQPPQGETPRVEEPKTEGQDEVSGWVTALGPVAILAYLGYRIVGAWTEEQERDRAAMVAAAAQTEWP